MRTKKTVERERMKAVYERCVREYHESEAEVIAEQSAEGESVV